MPKISDEKKEARRQQILDGAWRCFQRQGLHQTSMQDIIRESGLSAGAVYLYFTAKDELILAAVTTSLETLGKLLAEAIDGDESRSSAMLALRMTEVVQQFAARDGYDMRRIALLGWSEAQVNPVLRSRMREFYAGFRDIIADRVRRWPGASEVGGDSMAKLLSSVVLGYVVQSALLEDVEPRDIAEGLERLKMLE